jgi:hypothetical protein
MMTLLSKQPAKGKQLRASNCKRLRNDPENGNEKIGAISDLVENNPDRRGLMGDDVHHHLLLCLLLPQALPMKKLIQNKTPPQNMLPARMSIMMIREKMRVTLMMAPQTR